MEVRLDAVGDLPRSSEDVFLSIRVGDVQKQSRFAQSRTYRFDKTGNGRFGRVEVYRRVGSLTVSFEAAQGKGQDIFVPCELPGMQHLGLRMAVTGGLGANAKPESLPSLEQRGRLNKRMDAAQRYMSDHRLEEILADAMREVLNVKPGDPLSFLSSLLLKHRKPEEERLPEPAPGRPKAFEKLPPLDRAPLDQASKAAPPPLPSDEGKEPMAGGAPAAHKALAAFEATQKPIAEPVAVAPIGSRAYYSAHFTGASGAKTASGFAISYGRFPAFTEAGKPGAGAGPAADDSRKLSGKPEAFTFPVSGMATNSSFSSLYAKFDAFSAATEPPPAGAKAYYTANMVSSSGSKGLANLYGKFDAFTAAPKPGEGAKGYYAENMVCSSGSKGLANLYSKFDAFAAAPKPSEGTKAYYAANMVCSTGSKGLANLYSKFDAFTAVAKPSEGTKTYYAAHMVCNASYKGLTSVYGKFKAFSAVPKPSAGFAGYYASNLLKSPASDRKAMQDLFQKFAGFSDACARCAAKQEAAASTFVYQASVGTWLTRTPAKVTPSWCAMKTEKAQAETAPQAAAPAFVHRASVGTWCTRTPAKVTPSWCAMKTEKAASPPPAPAPSKLALPAYGAQASVGTWLVRKPPPLLLEGSSSPASSPPAPQPQNPWGWRPSVGTWLGAKPNKVLGEVPKARQGLIARRQDSLLKMDPAELFQTFQAELEAKEREIEELKRQLRTKGGMRR